MSDPFADKSPPWRLYTFLIVLLILAGTWYVGRLDQFLPDSIRSTSVLGTHAPAYKPQPAAAAGSVAAPAPTPPAK